MEECSKMLCSMPYGRQMILPFFSSLIALFLTLKALGSCDLIVTEWTIDCSSPLTTCTYLTNLHIGLVTKETLVALQKGDDNPVVTTKEMMISIQKGDDDRLTGMDKLCRRYTREEKDWIQSPTIWNGGTICLIICLCFGILVLIFLIFASSVECHPYLMKGISVCLAINAILSLVPMLILLKADVCILDDGVCDPSMMNCVTLCEMGMGSYHLFAACFMWLAASMTVWILVPSSVRLRRTRQRQRLQRRRILNRRATFQSESVTKITVLEKDDDDENDEEEEVRDGIQVRYHASICEDIRSDIEDNRKEGAEGKQESTIESPIEIEQIELRDDASTDEDLRSNTNNNRNTCTEGEQESMIASCCEIEQKYSDNMNEVNT